MGRGEGGMSLANRTLGKQTARLAKQTDLVPGASELRRVQIRAAAELERSLHDVGRAQGPAGPPVAAKA